MIAPVRLRLSRAKGYNLQAASRNVNGLQAINVARPSLLGNPFVVGINGTVRECVDLHARLIDGYLCISCDAPTVDQQRKTRAHVVDAVIAKHYRAHNVACWCALNAPCHGDTLLAAFT